MLARVSRSFPNIFMVVIDVQTTLPIDKAV